MSKLLFFAVLQSFFQGILYFSAQASSVINIMNDLIQVNGEDVDSQCSNLFDKVLC